MSSIEADRTAEALAGEERSPEASRRILEERARALARPLDEATPVPEMELVTFSIGGERYAVEAGCVEEVVLSSGLAPVPCTPPSVRGVVNHRGRIVTVVDLRRLLELPGAEAGRPSHVVVVAAGAMTFGIVADGVPEVTRVRAEDLAPSPSSLSHGVRPFVQGVTPAMALVIDVEALARQPRFIVNEEVG